MTYTAQEIEAAYRKVRRDPAFRSSEPKNLETKLFCCQVYERLTGKCVLPGKAEGHYGEHYGKTP